MNRASAFALAALAAIALTAGVARAFEEKRVPGSVIPAHVGGPGAPEQMCELRIVYGSRHAAQPDVFYSGGPGCAEQATVALASTLQSLVLAEHAFDEPPDAR